MKLISKIALFCLLFSIISAKEIKFQFSVDGQIKNIGLKLVENSAEPYEKSVFNDAEILAPPLNTDYFQRNGIYFRVDDSFPSDVEEAFLIIEHMDKNISLIQVRFDANRSENEKSMSDPAYTTDESSGVGYTCLGTGKQRRTIFRLDKPAFRHRQKFGADIKIEGVNSLTGITLKTVLDKNEWEKVKEEIPTDIQPQIKFSKPLQLVTSVGVPSKFNDDVEPMLDRMHEFCPVAQTLGFTAFESYVHWGVVESEKGRFDWSYYDAMVDKASDYKLKWFPLIIVGSAYTLPEWYHDSPQNVGFVCQEHNKRNNIQSIFCNNQIPYVKDFLNEFGSHYQNRDELLGIRLGPSGNFGESQYPAGGNWGYKGQREHIHIGWWAGDDYAVLRFREYLVNKYGNIHALNQGWGENFTTFDNVQTFIPQFAESNRKRKDFVDWYMWAMTDWCEKWGLWARQSMPNISIYQSAGGWGFVESGTDFTDQTKSMSKIDGGVRCSNETDSYVQNFYATRMISSAARFYGVDFGAEPAGFGSPRGLVGRIYNVLINNGDHLFYYYGNILSSDQGVAKWLENALLLDQRDDPVIEVAALYPDTKSKLDDGVFRNLYAFTFNQRAADLRSHLDYDFCSERMILDGALQQYKVLLFLWNDIVEAYAIDAIDEWVRQGGTVIYPYWVRSRMPLQTIEGDYSVFKRWLNGDTGKGKVIFHTETREPVHRYSNFIKKNLLEMDNLDPLTVKMLTVEKPLNVYISALKNGTLAVLNYNDEVKTITVSGQNSVQMKPYSIKIIDSGL